MRTDVFGPEAVPADVAAFNAAMAERFGNLPGIWDIGVEQARSGDFMPKPPPSPRAYDIAVGGKASLHVIPCPKPRGVLLHIHGGGLMLGGASQQDNILERIADSVGVTCVSVEYRLAPENPYPAGPDDCEAAALWIVREGTKHFGLSKFVIGGESAGGHLSAVTLLRLRDRHRLTPFSVALLNYGCFDIGMTPSARNWGEEKLVLNTPAIEAFRKSFLPPGTDMSNPDVSPLYADLRGMPAAIFSVGTRDALIDDSLFMAPRWLASGNPAELAIHPGACHGFLSLPNRQRNDAVARMSAFVDRYL